MLRSEANLLKQQLMALADQILKQEEAIVHEADRMNCSAFELRDANGRFMLSDLLVAKAQVWSALTILTKES